MQPPRKNEKKIVWNPKIYGISLAPLVDGSLQVFPSNKSQGESWRIFILGRELEIGLGSGGGR